MAFSLASLLWKSSSDSHHGFFDSWLGVGAWDWLTTSLTAWVWPYIGSTVDTSPGVWEATGLTPGFTGFAGNAGLSVFA